MEGLSAEDGIALQAEDAAAVAPDADENQGAAADQNAVQGRMANNAETCFAEFYCVPQVVFEPCESDIMIVTELILW